MTMEKPVQKKARVTWAAVKEGAQYAYKDGMKDPSKLAKCRSMSVFMFMN